MSTNMFSLPLSLSADNVIRAVRKQPPQGAKDLPPQSQFDPDTVGLADVTAGFNSVVEIAAGYCLRQYAAVMAMPDFVVGILPDDLRDFLTSQNVPFQSSFVNGLKIPAGLKTYFYTLRATFEASDIEFFNPHRVCVTYKGTAFLSREDSPVPNVQFAAPPKKPGNGAGPASLGATSGSKRSGGSFGTVLTASVRANVGSGGGVPVSFNELGTFDMVICCDYAWNTQPALKRVDIYADLSTAKVTLNTPQGDAKRFFDQFLLDGSPLTRHGMNASRIPLTPTLCLAGKNPVNVDITEISPFDVEVFHLGKKPRQAMVAGFNIKPGCNGTVESVGHFIGDFDYGIISDEYLIQRVFKHKFRLGGFYRHITAEVPVKVTRKGKTEDATENVVLELTNLDIVSIELDANSAIDYIRLGGYPGSAVLTPQSVRLGDGTIVGPDKVDLGPPLKLPWTVFTRAETVEALSSDQQIKSFQLSAHKDAYQHIAKPFARFPEDDSLQVMYTRTEGVIKMVYFLGNIGSVFP